MTLLGTPPTDYLQKTHIQVALEITEITSKPIENLISVIYKQLIAS